MSARSIIESVTGLQRIVYSGETLRQWLDRHEIPVNPDGTILMYHATPKSTARIIKAEGLRDVVTRA